mmetsp:Transcript_48513/g.87166  ORF Transcript_48513/g.87166 Transcript_48513/m.87166 type:complete len:161 (-) Transcript_48513:330-812(-)
MRRKTPVPDSARVPPNGPLGDGACGRMPLKEARTSNKHPRPARAKFAEPKRHMARPQHSPERSAQTRPWTPAMVKQPGASRRVASIISFIYMRRHADVFISNPDVCEDVIATYLRISIQPEAFLPGYLGARPPAAAVAFGKHGTVRAGKQALFCATGKAL